MSSPHDLPDYPSYYNQPVIRSGHWHWLITVYFWIGGITGASYVISAIGSLWGRKEDEEISRWGRYTALVGIVISPVLLIWDLGKPERFLNMLRIFKPSSPMSVGTWGVVAFSPFVAISAVLQMARDGWFDKVGWVAKVGKAISPKLFEPLGILFGLFMATYTGVLISNTVVPLWARTRTTNAAVFLLSGFNAATSAISLCMAFTGRGTRAQEQKLAAIQTGAIVAEAALLVHELDHLKRLRTFLLKGKASRYFYGATALSMALPVLLGTPRQRWLKIVKAVSGVMGGLLLRAAIIEGGHASAQDPRAYHYFNEIEQQGSSDAHN